MEKRKFRIYFLLFFFLLLNSYINCQTNTCSSSYCQRDGNLCKHTDSIRENCDPRCLPNIFSRMCHYCPEDDGKQYYKITGTDTDNGCKRVLKSDCKKIIYNSFQCVDSCENYFSLGSYCYPSCTGNMKPKSQSDHECECVGLFYKETIDGKTQYHCFRNDVLCNPDHQSYDHDTKQCFTSNDCGNSQKARKVIHRNDLSNIFRCSNSCIGDEFLYEKSGNKYCIDENCPDDKYFYYIREDKQKVCVDNCNSVGLYYKQTEGQKADRKCVDITECTSVIGSRCYSTDCLHNDGSKVCVQVCEDDYIYKDEELKICYKKCPSKFRYQNNTCVQSNKAGNCFYTDADPSADNKICYSSCLESDKPFQIHNSKQCVSSCSTDYLYTFENDKVCYSSCGSIPFIGKNYYSDGHKCHCFLYGVKNDGHYQCYDDEASSYNDGFRYKKRNQCLKECTTFIYEVHKDTNEKKLDICYESVDECRDKKLYYYNTDERRCYASLPSGKKPNEIDFETSLPKEDEGRNTYTDNCGSIRFPKKTTKGICKEKCDKDEYFYPNNPNECKSGCAANEYIGYNNECLTGCQDYYIEITTNKYKCVRNCKDYSKFYFEGDHKCYDSCIKSNAEIYFYNLENNKCVKSCMDNNNANKYAYKITNAPQKCLAKPEGKYYDINNIILEDKCTLISKDDPQKCVGHCNGMKVYHKRCVEHCPDIEGPYVHIQISITPLIYIDKCLINCLDEKDSNGASIYNYIIAYRNECVKKCPQNYISDQEKRCFYSACSEGLKFNPTTLKCEDCRPYEVKEIIDDQNVHRNIYICKTACNTEKKYIKDINDQECVDKCPPNNNYIGADFICRNHCDNDDSGNYALLLVETPYKLYQCVKYCPTEDNYFYIVEKKNGVNFKKEECVLRCPENFPFVVKNKYECLQSCPNDKEYYYIDEKDETGNYYTCTSKFKCGHQYTNKYYCEGKCCDTNGIKNKKKKYIENNKCVEECSSGYKKQKLNYNDNNIIFCKPNCDPNEFVNGDECLQKCPSDLNYIGRNNICRNGCKSINGDPIYYYQISNDDYQIYKCVYECPYQDIYGSTNNLCLSECDIQKTYISKEENFCHINCYKYSTNKFTLKIMSGTTASVSKCLPECNDATYPNYKYYYENVNVCLESCKNDDYAIEVTNKCIRNCSELGPDYYFYENTDESGAQKKFCVKQCHPPKPFLRGNICFPDCDSSSDEKFYIKEFKHGETFLQKKCLTDCPEDYPFYYKERSPPYECLEKCDTGHYYVPNFDLEKNTILCLSSCTSSGLTYKYKIENETSKICYQECPSERRYHKDISKAKYSSDNNCYEECPPDAPFHMEAPDLDQYICKTLEECDNDYVDYDRKLCLRKDEVCPSTKRLSKYKYNSNSNYKYVCLNDCMEPFGKYPTDYNTCVNNCENDDLVKDFYIDGDLFSNLNLKKDPQSPKCVCKNLFYTSSNGKKICFDGTIAECKDLDDYKYNRFGTKECILNCTNGILSPLEDICFPSTYRCINYTNTILNYSQVKCDCEDKFYFNDNGEKICLKTGEICPKGYDTIYNPETKECYKDGQICPTPFDYLFLGKYCLRICPGNSTVSGKSCSCENPYNYWRQVSQSNFECIKDCYNIHLVSIPSENNRCVEKCTGHYSRYYNNECYHTCDDESIDPNIKIKNAIEVFYKNFNLAKYKCECKKEDYWYIDNITNIKYCIPDCFAATLSFNYVIKSTRECVYECPPEYYFFNNECFINCDTEAYSLYHLNVKYVEPFQECQCRGLWLYKDAENKIKECSMEEICELSNTEKRFLFNGTQCLEKCPDGWQGFNYLCYNNCPEKTIDINSDDGLFNCSCNLKDGYWYEYQEYGNTYYRCGLEECPKFHNTTDNKSFVRKNLIESEKKCVNSCRKEGNKKNKNFFSLRNICVEFCPDYTYVNEDNDACLFFDLNDTRITNLQQLKDAANVQVKELYEQSEKTGGFLFNKFNASLEIYSVDRNDSLKNLSFKSNLTYIDFGTCLNKLYSDKSLDENSTILVAKYDLSPGANINVEERVSKNINTDKYLINPVEYELFSSNVSEKLDAFVCDPYEIVISYPLAFNKFDIYVDGINQNEYRKKFELGKEIHYMDNEIDTFNVNDSIYKNFCKGLEIDRKDLVFEDRYKYLYPNKILCESNCTMNNTDFELERINCLCTFKNKFDLNRVERETNDILNDPNFVLPTQSSSNIEAMKCLFNFTLKEAILYNDAFYFCTVGLLVQIVMMILSACLGIKNIKIDIKHLLNKMNLKKDNIGKNLKIKKGPGYKNENIIGSTNRPLNNPPKKNNVNEKDNEDFDIDSINEENDINNTKIDKNSSNNEGGNNEINLKKGNKGHDKTKILDNNEMNVEYIPPDYNFKFFKPSEKGVMKKIERSKIPFPIKPDTIYLIEIRDGIEYPEDYLDGPYFQDQNIVIVVDDKIKDVDKIAKYIKEEKINKNLKPKNKNENNDKNISNKDDAQLEKNLKKKINLFGSKKNNFNINEKSSFEYKKPSQSKKGDKDYSNDTLFEEFYEDNDLELKKDEMNIFTLIKREQLFLRIEYDTYVEKKHGNVLCRFLAEILDKIYFVKIFLFLRKADIFSIHCSLYMLYHIILLGLLCGFFTIKVIKKIWEQENFPGLNFYLLYGLISHVVVWVVYQIFLCILDNNDKFKDLVILKKQLEIRDNDNIGVDDIEEKNESLLTKKYNDLIFQIKMKTALFYIISILLSLFITVYLISFFSLYTGTKRKVLKAYYISIIEILLIKFVYGFILSLIRLISILYNIKLLYSTVRIFNKYLS